MSYLPRRLVLKLMGLGSAWLGISNATWGQKDRSQTRRLSRGRTPTIAFG